MIFRHNCSDLCNSLPARLIGLSWKAALVVAVLLVEAAVALLALLDHLVAAVGAAIILSDKKCKRSITRLPDLILLIEDSKFAFKSCVYLWCIQCHVNYRATRQDTAQEMERKLL